MHHGINKGEASGNDVTVEEHKKIMDDLYEAGFQAITMQQMADFMYNNAKIPERSALIIVDDRHFAEYFNDHFRRYYEQWGWPVVNAYIGIDERTDLWAENATLASEGWVDYQAHGYIHNIPISESSTDEFITSEMQGGITSLQKYMNKTPIAYVWPGGGFSKRAVEIGTQLGYKLGFTVNQRGPVMYNWIPQADAFNASNPLAIPETPAGNPLMTIPRYWSASVRQNIDAVRVIGEEAKLFAEQNKAIELEYYDIVCAQTYGQIP
jgi:rhodanese-related sulfurtransferase